LSALDSLDRIRTFAVSPYAERSWIWDRALTASDMPDIDHNDTAHQGPHGRRR